MFLSDLNRSVDDAQRGEGDHKEDWRDQYGHHQLAPSLRQVEPGEHQERIVLKQNKFMNQWIHYALLFTKISV